MLNISENSIKESFKIEQYKSFRLLRKSRINRLSLYLLTALFFAVIIALFLPWTQNIATKGYVTTRSPEQRPQAIQSVIGGRIERWLVKEGDYVNAGDTVVVISEIKSEYFDPELIARTAEQYDAKSQSIGSYDDKITALKNQIIALEAARQLKLQQTENKIEQSLNKIKIDSIDLVAFNANLEIAINQLDRIKELYDKGLKSLSELQEKELKIQESSAKVTVQQNKLINQRNELLNLKLELLSIEREYADKIAKSQSDQQSALSDKLETVANTAKLQNQLSNYTVRQQFYQIIAPQSGYITKTLKKGIGEIIKEGTDIATIMPDIYDLAVEAYLRPQDLPLVSLGNSVRIRFDGWPAFIISGWPEASTGIFTGQITAVDQYISDNGFYRALISPDPKAKAWPKDLRVGAGSNSFIMIKDVPLWYELWRQLNGFPPDYYKEEADMEEVKRKAPIKSIK